MSKLKVNELDTESGTTITVTAGKTLAGTDIIGATQIAANAVTTAKILDDNVTYGKLQDTTTANRVLGAVAAGTVGEVEVATDMVADNAVTLAKMAGLARGKIIVGDASGDPSALALGTSTYLLTSDGTDAAWAVAPAGGIAASEIKGWRIRPVFNRTAATTVKLCGTFAYQHAGTTTQILTGADVTFTRSDTSGTDQFNYLYIDDSAVVTAGNSTITASELISSPTAPTLNTTKGGFYNGNDRCVFAWRQNTSNDIYQFSPLSPYSVDGVVVHDFTWQFVNYSGGWGTGWKDYTTGTDHLPRPCGPSGLAVAMYIDLGGSHAGMRVGNAGNHYDMYMVDAPWEVCAPVDSTGKFSIRLISEHSTYTQIFYTRGWVMSPLL